VNFKKRRDSSLILELFIIREIFKMPQLLPFYFLNQLSFSFLTLLTLIFVFSKYILPLFTFTQVVRMYITKLG